MRRLVWASLRRHPGAAIAPFLVTTAASILASIALHFLMTAVSPASRAAIAAAPKGTAGALISVGVVALLIGIGVPAVLTISQVSSLAVRVGEHEYASWRLAGASPRQVGRLVRLRAMLIALAAAICGVIVSIPCLQTATDALISGTTTGLQLSTGFGVLPTLATVVIVILITTIASIRPARRAQRIAPIMLLHGSDEPEKPRPLRWVLASLAFLGSLGLAAGVLTSQNVSSGSLATVMMGFALIVTIAILSPIVIPGLVRWLTGIVPDRVSPTWYLARHYAVSRLHTSTATVTPLAVGASIIGVYFSALSTWSQAGQNLTQNASANAIQGITLFGPGALLAALASIITITIVGRGRALYQATIRSAGATKRQLLLSPVFEALIYSATAFLIAVAISSLTSLTFGISMRATGAPPAFALDIGAIALACGLGFIGILLAIGIPTRRLSTMPISDAPRNEP